MCPSLKKKEGKFLWKPLKSGAESGDSSVAHIVLVPSVSPSRPLFALFAFTCPMATGPPALTWVLLLTHHKFLSPVTLNSNSEVSGLYHLIRVFGLFTCLLIGDSWRWKTFSESMHFGHQGALVYHVSVLCVCVHCANALCLVCVSCCCAVGMCIMLVHCVCACVRIWIMLVHCVCVCVYHAGALCVCVYGSCWCTVCVSC